MRMKIKYILLLLVMLFHGCICQNKNTHDDEETYISNIDLSASRESRVAPLSVHFTACFSTSTAGSRAFHDLDYTWDFNDPGSGHWGNSGKSRNMAKGPVAAHIFETPGDYTVNLTVRDGTGMTGTGSFNITVQDPDIIYGGSDNN